MVLHHHLSTGRAYLRNHVTILPRVVGTYTSRRSARVGLRHHSCACSNKSFDSQLTLPFLPCYCFTNLHSDTRHVLHTNLHGGTQPVHESIVYSTHPLLRLHRPATLTNISTACISSAKVEGSWLTPYKYPSHSLRLHAPLTVMPTSHLYLHGCS